MNDVNKRLRIAYFTKLSTLSYESDPVPCYYGNVPPGIDPPVYVVFSPVTNNPNGTMQTQVTDASMRVEVHTFGMQQNAGNACDDIAGLVLQSFLPTTTATLNLGVGLQCLSTQLSDDRAETFDMQDGRKYVRRIITFRHKIFHQ